MTYAPDDKRALYQRVVDDLRDQIRDGIFDIDARVPSANELAATYDIAPMTAQRALRELQNEGLIFAIQGKGSFVRPDATDRLGTSDDIFKHPGKDNPDLDRRLKTYRASNAAIEQKIMIANAHSDETAINAAYDELLINIRAHADLLQEHYRYLQAHGHAPADEPAVAKPANRAPRKRTPKS